MKLQYALILCLLIACSTKPIKPEERTIAAASSIKSVKFNSKLWESISFEELKTYKTMWVVSDIHGQLPKLVSLLSSDNAEKMLVQKGDWYHWNAKTKNNLIVVVGDTIDKGPDSVGVVRLLSELKAEAAKAANKSKNNRVILLLGNHEVEYLAFPLTIPQELNDSADAPTHRKWLGGDLGPGVNPTELSESNFARTVKTFKLGALVGSWVFTHSGFFEVEPNVDDIQNYVSEIESFAHDEGYKTLVDEAKAVSAPLMRHNWFRKEKNRNRMIAILDELKLEGSVFGHDPDAFEDLYATPASPAKITTDTTGRMIGTDVGMSDEMGSPEGMMKCPIAKILKSKKMNLVDSQGTLCTQISSTKESKIEMP